MKLYFSHPTFTFNTKTERKCIDIINEHIGPDELTNPADHGIKHDLKSDLKESDALVAMAVSRAFTYVVWKEIEFVKENDVQLYTFMVEDKRNIGPLVKGIPEDIKRLSKKQSRKLSHEITKGDYQESLISSLIGSHGSRF